MANPCTGSRVKRAGVDAVWSADCGISRRGGPSAGRQEQEQGGTSDSEQHGASKTRGL